MATLKEMTLSNDFADYIFNYAEADFLENIISPDYNYQLLNPYYYMLHLNNNIFPIETIAPSVGFSSVPSLFTLTSTVSPEASGVLQIRNIPALNLTGRNILVGFLDTGINYTHPAFLNENGRTRILRIWDQTIESGTPPANFVYGSEYTEEEINQALQSDAPYNLVPSKDEHGHGTLLAGIACGQTEISAEFTGIAPDSYLAVVKLKEAKPYLSEYYAVNSSEPLFQETDIMLALSYLNQLAEKLRLPLVICIGIGTNQGSHNGQTPLDYSLSSLRTANGLSIVVAAGNEAGRQHHYFGKVPDSSGFREVEIRVPENSSGYNVELRGTPPEIFSVGVISPLGEIVERIPARMNQNQNIRFVLEHTTLSVSYELIAYGSVEQVILMRFRNPSPGVWKIRVYCSNYLNGEFHMWLPVTGMVNPDIQFLNPDPDTTIVVPGNSERSITCSTYNAYTGSIYAHSSRGFTPIGLIKPDLAAPGVNVTGPDLRDGYINGTGSGTAAAITAGASALVLQWGRMRTPSYPFSPAEVKNLFIRGAARDSALNYPNREWGYGKLNVYGSFSSFLNP